MWYVSSNRDEGVCRRILTVLMCCATPSIRRSVRAAGDSRLGTAPRRLEADDPAAGDPRPLPRHPHRRDTRRRRIDVHQPVEDAPRRLLSASPDARIGCPEPMLQQRTRVVEACTARRIQRAAGAVDLGVPGPVPPEPLGPFGPPPRETFLELHQPQPPTASTGTTYSIEMYQCIRQARAFMVRP